MPTVLIAANPKSGNADRRALVEELQQLLQNQGYRVVVLQDLDELEKQVQLHFETKELEAVVAAGGDGTVSAVLTRIPAECPIAIFPLGSENLLAKQYQILRSPAFCTEMIVRGKTVQLDAMEVITSALPRPMIATLMASVGFDSDVVRLVHVNRKSHITRWAYRWQCWMSWRTYRWPLLSVSLHPGQNDAPALKRTAKWLFVFNVPQYAAGLQIMRDANPADGKLGVGFFTNSGPIRGIFQYLDVLLGKHRNRSDWQEYQTTKIELGYACSNPSPSGVPPTELELEKQTVAPEPSNAEVGTVSRERKIPKDGVASLQVDGDWVGELPASIEIKPARIRLIVP